MRIYYAPPPLTTFMANVGHEQPFRGAKEEDLARVSSQGGGPHALKRFLYPDDSDKMNVFVPMEEYRRRFVQLDSVDATCSLSQLEADVEHQLQVLSPRTLSPFSIENTSVHRKGV